MATAAVNLSVPAPADDSMEMSSPGQHNLDEDIDFGDWELENVGTNVDADERMMDDGEHTRPATATDDVMEDDVLQGEQTVVQEEVMQDSPTQEQQLEDEDLIDYSDDELQDKIGEDAGAPGVHELAQDAAPVLDTQAALVGEEVVHVSDEPAAEYALEDVASANAVTDEAIGPLVTGDTAAVSYDDTVAEGYSTEGVSVLEQATTEPRVVGLEQHAEVHAEPEDDAQQVTESAELRRPTISLDVSAQTPIDGPATPTDTGLHATTVRFGELQFPLFKSRNQPEGLLKNDNLASLSLGELIQNCRQRLAIKTGENVSEDQDLVLGFDQLGLVLVEDSRAAFECSLDEVLDIYLQLHRNDEAEDIPPFSMTLSLQMKFTSSVSVLRQAAAGGTGMSTFGLDHTSQEQVGEYDEHDEGHGEEDQQEYEQQYQYDETADGQAYEQAQNEGSIPELPERDTNDHHGEYEEYPAEDQGKQNYYQENEEYHEELGEGQYYEEENNEVSQLLDEHALEGEGQFEESTDTANHATLEQTEPADDVAQPLSETADDAEKADSTATSTTFHGDDGQDTTGEYTDEDLIDWDDDSDLTSDPSEKGLVETSTLQAEKELGTAAQNDQPHDGLDQDPADAAAQGQNHQQHDSTNAEDTADVLGTEDYIGNFEEQDYEAGNLDHGADPTNLDSAYAEEFDQANETAAQPEDLSHLEGQQGEDDPFQTAYELFDEADQEHGQQAPAPDATTDDTTLVASTNTGEQQHGDTDDFIDFELDEETTAEAAKAQHANTADAGSHTPFAKRSFEDLAGDGEIDFDSPEPKKARAS